MVFVCGITRLTHSGLSILGEKVLFFAYNVKNIVGSIMNVTNNSKDDVLV